MDGGALSAGMVKNGGCLPPPGSHYDDDCGCGKDDLAPCAGIDCFSHCRPGVAVILDDGEPGIGPREEKK